MLLFGCRIIVVGIIFVICSVVVILWWLFCSVGNWMLRLVSCDSVVVLFWF